MTSDQSRKSKTSAQKAGKVGGKVSLLASQNDTFRREVISTIPSDAFQNNTCWECLADHELRGCLVLNDDIVTMPEADKIEIINRLIQFQDFTLEDDPSGEHRLGKFCFKDHVILWKIFYANANQSDAKQSDPNQADANQNEESRNPLDPSVTIRILNVMLSSKNDH